MVGLIEPYLEIYVTDEDGHSKKERLESIARQTKKQEVVPKAPTPPRQLLYLWWWFWELSSRRGSSGFGPLPITEADIWFFQCNRNIRLKDWELRFITRADMVYMTFFAERAREKKAASKKAAPKLK